MIHQKSGQAEYIIKFQVSVMQVSRHHTTTLGENETPWHNQGSLKDGQMVR